MKYSNFEFTKAFNALRQAAYQNAVNKGWWDEPRETGTLIALMHSELSEALEAERHGNPPSDHIPEFSGVEEEFADVIIRIMDLAERNNYRVAEAVLAKMEFNTTRPNKHGGKRF